MKSLIAPVALVVAVAAFESGSPAAGLPTPVAAFPHEKHQALLSTCTMCHAGVGEPEGPVYPNPTLCATCHDGSMAPAISWTPPAERGRANLRFAHGEHMRAADTECADCHVEPGSGGTGIRLAVTGQCSSCHAQSEALRNQSVWHGSGWRDRHAAEAAASPQTCADCHVRADCLDCHRTDAASGSPGYHPANFLSRHPAAAYSRETSCADCHNVRAFCSTCHAQAGLVASRPLGSRYHDANRSFVAGHGVAARQSLESCVACHAERDCLTCHSALGRYRFSPHGPDFNAERLRKRNPSMCAVCHGTTIPGGGPDG